MEIEAAEQVVPEDLWSLTDSLDMEKMLDQVLSKYDNPRYIQRIGVIDLTLQSPLTNTAEWQDEFKKALQDQLQAYAGGSGLPGNVPVTHSSAYSVASADFQASEPLLTENSGTCWTLGELMFVLQHGFLPWSIGAESSFQREWKSLLDRHRSQFIREIATILTLPDVRKRLSAYLSKAQKDELVELLLATATWNNGANLLSESLPSSNKSDFESGKTSAAELRSRLEQSLNLKNEEEPGRYTNEKTDQSKESLTSLPYAYNPSSDPAIKIDKHRDAVAHDKEVDNTINKVKDDSDVMSQGHKEHNTSPGHNVEQLQLLEERNQPISNRVAHESFTFNLNDQTNRAERDESIFISNAGLVLINPALVSQYWRNLGWVKGKAFVSPGHRSKAAVWLHHVVYNEVPPQEYQLALNKIWCGLPINEFIDTRQEFTDSEIAATESLLQDIINTWEVLRNTSIEGLRTSFLQRTGKLRLEGNSWHLHVASRSFDMLIDKLPWTFSIIKLPWMEQNLFTQWRTKI